MTHQWNEEKAKELEKKKKQLKEMESKPDVRNWMGVRYHNTKVPKAAKVMVGVSVVFLLSMIGSDVLAEKPLIGYTLLAVLIVLFVVGTILCVIPFRWGLLVSSAQNSDDVKAYEKLESEIERLLREKENYAEECTQILQAAVFAETHQNFMQAHGTGHLLVYAGARFDGKYDRSGTRRVYVDGQFYGEARPWALLGLPSGNHSVFVQYVESVGGRLYELKSNVVSICADNCSMALFCSKDGMSGSKTAVYDFNYITKFLSAAEEDGGPAFPY